MNIRKAIAVFAWLAGMAIIIAAFLIFAPESMPKNIKVLDIVVSLIAYASLFIDILILVPWIDLNDPAKRTVGSLGMRWTVVYTYIIFAVGLMVLGLVYQWGFQGQLLGQGALLALYLLGWSAVFGTNDKVASVYAKEEQVRQSLTELKETAASLAFTAQGATPALADRINALKDEIRYISPNPGNKAQTLDRQAADLLSSLEAAIRNGADNDRLVGLIEQCERIIDLRKNTI